MSKPADSGRKRLSDNPVNQRVAKILARVRWNRNPGFLVHDVQRLIGRAVDGGIQDLDLTHAQLRVILHLCRQEGMSQVALADEMGVKKASVGVLLEKLAEKKLIDRRPHPVDRRINLIFLNENAHTMLQPILKTGSVLLEDLMDGFSEAETEVLVDMLMRIKANAERMIDGQSANVADTKVAARK